MNEMQNYLTRVSKELGVRVLISYSVKLSDDRIIIAEGLFPDFGSSKGTLLFQPSANIDPAARQDYKLQGYTASTFWAPSSDDGFDLESVMEMLIEWGWTGEESKKPLWFDKIDK